jgi:hypothetical protein
MSVKERLRVRPHLAALGHSRSAEFARTGHSSDEGAIRSGTVLPFTLLRLARTA